MICVKAIDKDMVIERYKTYQKNWWKVEGIICKKILRGKVLSINISDKKEWLKHQ